MQVFDFIIWSANPEVLPFISWIPVRWYGVLFALAFIFGQQIYFYMYKREGKPEKDVETLTIYLIVATILGARLGHVFFYEPDRFLANPLDILKIWKGGLASHGAAVGIIMAIYLYSNYFIKIGFTQFIIRKKKREGQSFLYVFDRIAIVVALGGAFIRLGNFFNAEIIGKPTDSPVGVVFARDIIDRLEYEDYIEKVNIQKREDPSNHSTSGKPVNLEILFKKGNVNEKQVSAFLGMEVKRILTNSEYVKLHLAEPPDRPLDYDLQINSEGQYVAIVRSIAIPRHAAQLYEAISCVLLFIGLFLFWYYRHTVMNEGRIFGIFLIILFGLRFLYEFLKENQVAFEENMDLNMGQILSIPLVVFGIVLILRRGRKSEN